MERALGDLLRRHRLAAELTQENLAERAGLSSQAIGSLERGDRRRPYRHTLDALSEALGLNEAERDELSAAARGRRRPRTSGGEVTPPRQLPLAEPDFTGRAAESAILAGALTSGDGVPVCAVTGMGGVGKTALALRAAHAVAGHFRDGQVYLDLRSHDRPLDTRAAMSHLLRAVGGRVDEGGDAPGVYRSALAGRRVLLVLDNASGPEQVADLLPGTSGCAAIVTARHSLDSLPCTIHMRLDVLGEDASLDLLATVVGAERLTAEPEAARRLAAHCGGLPLALHLAGSRLAARPAWPVAHLADRLDDQLRRLDELERREQGVRACFAVSTGLLDAEDRRAYALLGALPPGELSTVLCATAFDTTEAAAERVLERLTDLALLDAAAPGSYKMHDLLHAHAREEAGRLLDPGERAAAIGRVAGLLVAAAWRGLELAQPEGIRRAWSGEVRTDAAPAFASSAEAFAWLDGHRAQLVEIVSAPEVPPESLVRLSLGLFPYYLSRGHLLDWSVLASAAATAADKGDDRLAAAATKMDHGMALCDLAAMWGSDPSEGVDMLRRGLKDFHEIGAVDAVAICLINASATFLRIDRLDDAAECAAESLALCRDVLGSTTGQASAAFNLGVVHGRRGEHATELAHYRDSLALLGSADSLGKAEVLRGIAGAMGREGDHEGRVRTLRSAAAMSARVGDLSGEAMALEELGGALLDTGEETEAKAVLEECLAGSSRIGDGDRVERVRRLLSRGSQELDLNRG